MRKTTERFTKFTNDFLDETDYPWVRKGSGFLFENLKKIGCLEKIKSVKGRNISN